MYLKIRQQTQMDSVNTDSPLLEIAPGYWLLEIFKFGQNIWLDLLCDQIVVSYLLVTNLVTTNFGVTRFKPS